MIILIALYTASVFSLNGLGEDTSVFRSPFTNIGKTANISIRMKPEFTILNQGSDFRGIFWTHPFQFSITAPVGRGFAVGFGNLERFDQSFDIYYQDDALDIYLDGDGGIDELYGTVAQVFSIGEVAVRGSYLFGNASEIWEYSMGGYQLVDSFSYSYRGMALGIGLRLLFASAHFEIGEVRAETQAGDTTFSLPRRLTLGLSHAIFNGQASLLYERAFWSGYDEYRDCNRIKLSFVRTRTGIAYHFNPWYMGDIVEHGLTLDHGISIMRGAATVGLKLECAFRRKNDFNEFSISPGIHLTIRELFARRR